MIRMLDPQADKFLTDLSQLTARLDKAQREITSGRRINSVSDDPDQVPNLLESRSELQLTEQIRTNLGRVQHEVDSAEAALQQAVTAMERIAVLGAQGATSIMGPAQRQTLANEVATLLEQLVNISRTTVEGRYIFSGDTDGTAPYTFDISQPFPVSAYQGAAATRQVMSASGTLFSIARTAAQIFDDADPNNNVFQAVNNLRVALLANDLTAITTALSTVNTANGHLNNQLAGYGATQNQVAAAVDFAHKQELRLKTHISEIEDADLTEAVLDLNQARFLQETALTSQARLRRISLFDYLG